MISFAALEIGAFKALKLDFTSEAEFFTWIFLFQEHRFVYRITLCRDAAVTRGMNKKSLKNTPVCTFVIVYIRRWDDICIVISHSIIKIRD